MKEKLLNIIEHYGVLAQLKYLQSEVFELNEAIINFENCNETYNEDFDDKELFINKLGDFRGNIAEEIADVLVMINQFKEHYMISDEYIDEVMNYKIERQLKRIEEEKTKEDIFNKCMIEGNRSLDKLDAIKNILEENKDLGVAGDLDYMVIKNKILEIIGDKSE